MASLTPTVLIVSRDPEVNHVTASLQADGINSRTVSTARDLNRAASGSRGRCVAVLDGDLAADPSFPAADVRERLRSLPLLVLLPAEGEARISHGLDPQRTSIEEYARKPIAASVLLLRIKALILAAGLPLPP